MAASKRQTALSAQPAQQDYEAARPWPLPMPSRAELASAFAQALDLAEGQRPGHAARVCYIALNLARSMGLPSDLNATVYYAALFHDSGAASATAELCRLVNVTEEAIFCAGPDKPPEQLGMEIAPNDSDTVVKLIRVHPQRGAQVAGDLGFDAAVQEAIGAHHERWDGHGYPRALEGEDIPIAARLVAAGDLIEYLISADDNPLITRRTFLSEIADYSGNVVDPALIERAQQLAADDAFWLGLYNDDLPRTICAICPDDDANAEQLRADFEAFTKVFAALADAKGDHTLRHSERTAELADRLAQALGFRDARRAVLRTATLLHNVGLLGVPARVIAKPDILSLSEMEAMRHHPTYSQMILESLPGLEDAARWVGAHHERPDGKGYPEMWEDDAIPLEARIIAVADTYVAITSKRPYRRALSPEDAVQVLQGGAGTQLDRKLVDLLCSLEKPTSSRTAQRSRRRR